MIRTAFSRSAFSGLLLVLALAQAEPALAAQGDVDLLQSYVGDWSGKGSLGTVDGEETVKCSLAVSSSSPTRVQFNGRCAIAGGTISLKGTMGFIEERSRFEAVLNSNVSFLQDQVAIGRRSASGLVFTMRPTDPDTNSDFDVGVDLALKNGVISVNAKVTDTVSGASTIAKVPLEKKT